MTLASQAEYEGSIPFTRSNPFLLHDLISKLGQPDWPSAGDPVTRPLNTGPASSAGECPHMMVRNPGAIYIHFTIAFRDCPLVCT